MAGKLKVSELDFDALKTKLKDFLKQQSEFTDYDFEGAGINILLDILAYNTHYNAFYLNMVANEMFMDSAALRQSIVSHAKLLGYTPRSNTASQAVVNVAVTKSNTDPTTTLTMPRFTTFTSQALDGQSYNFVTVDEYVTSNATGTVFNFDNVRIKEGVPVSYVFTVDSQTNPKQIFEIPDDSIDTSTLEVIVQVSNTETQQRTYRLSTTTNQIEGNSEVYYLEEGRQGKYNIYFGDNVFGKKLDDGNIVVVSYIKTKGEFANGLNTFRITSTLLPSSSASVTTVVKSAGGSPRESAEDVKFSAPKSFISNNRAITKNDYITLINKNYPYFDSVNVWGGEEEQPPVYGKVFIAAKPKLGYEITETEKEFLKNEVIAPFSVLTVTPEFVDVDYNYLLVYADVTYDPRLTTKKASEIASAVRAGIRQFSLDTLNTFDSTFKLSRLLRDIDDSDDSILSSTATVVIQKQIEPILGQTETYTLNYNVPLTRGATGRDKIYSSPAYQQEDATGVIRNVFLEETPESFSGIESVSVLTPGANYAKTPLVAVEGDGVGASVRPIIVNGQLKSVVVDNPGTGYTTAIITIIPAVGDTGSGATARANIQGSRGTLRSYYFDDVGAKKILNANAGTINYVDGVIVLNNFAPISLGDASKVLKIHAKPSSLEFGSERAMIVTLDTFDPSAITVNVKASNS